MNLLKMQTVCKDYIWGGTKLRDKYGKKSELERLAESWELSCHKDGPSVIAGTDTELRDYIAKNPSVLGTKNTTGELPILIKLIDAQDNLSVQVHPSNEEARKWENDNGKTEMWYVMEAEENAKIIYGTKKDITKDELRTAIEENRATELLNTVDSKKGDVFFVEAGTIHAIGKGNLIAEIQQNSNVTYRLYDYGRLDKFGKPRELHIEKGVKCSSTEKTKIRCIPDCSDGSRLLGSCEYFQTKEFTIDGSSVFCADNGSYHALINVGGSFKIKKDEETLDFGIGETVFIPAGAGEYELFGKGTVLLTQNKPDYYVGIDLGGTNIVAAVVDEYGTIYAKSSTPTAMPRDYKAIFDDMARCAIDAAEKSGISFDDIVSVGIGCPGAINIDDGIVEFSNNLDFYDVPIKEYMENALNKPIFVDNDANCAAWGEFVAGSGKGTKNMILITLGTGVGSGIIVDGKLIHGAYDKGAEIGHSVLVVGGEKCTCGRRGCFEAYASATALINQTKKKMNEDLSSDMWAIVDNDINSVVGKTPFMSKDGSGRAVLDTYLDYLAEGVVNIVNIFQPEVVCIGGGVSNAGDVLTEPINKKIKDYSFARFGKKQSVAKIASLRGDAGIIGAALINISK